MAAVRPIELSLTVSPVCVRLVMTMLNVNIASVSLTCEQYGILMLGHNMLRVSRVRTDNRTLLCANPRPWITQSQSQCDCHCRRYDSSTSLRRYPTSMIQSWTNVELDLKSPSFVLSLKSIVIEQSLQTVDSASPVLLSST